MRTATLVSLLAGSTSGALYDGGDEFTGLTGGWISAADPRCVYSAEGTVYTSKAPTLTRGESELTMELTGNLVSGTVRTAKRIDLSGYSSITFTGELGRGSGYADTGAHPYIVAYVQDAMGADKYYYTTAASKSELQNGTTVVDVSKLSGDYYVAIGLYSSASFPVRYKLKSCIMS